MKKEEGKAKKKKNDHLVNLRMSKNITQYFETQYSLCQVGILLRYFAFSLVFEEKDWYSRLLRGLLCEKRRVRCPNVTSNPFFDYFPFHV